MVEVKVGLEAVVEKIDKRGHWSRVDRNSLNEGFTICLDDFRYTIEEDVPLEPVPQDVELRVFGDNNVPVANYNEVRTNPPGPLCKLYDGVKKRVEDGERKIEEEKERRREETTNRLIDKFNRQYGK